MTCARSRGARRAARASAGPRVSTGGQRRAASPWGFDGGWSRGVPFGGGYQGRRHGSLFSHSVGPRSSSCVRHALVASVLAAWPSLLRERMETTDGAETHEHARVGDVSSASAGDNLHSMPEPATPGNATALAPAASGMPAAPDESLCVEAESASASTPITVAAAPACAADAGTAESGCPACANRKNKGLTHTCNKKRAQPNVGARGRSTRQRGPVQSLLLLPPPEQAPPVQPPPPAAEAATSTPAWLL